jgi:hypothetical protein
MDRRDRGRRRQREASPPAGRTLNGSSLEQEANVARYIIVIELEGRDEERRILGSMLRTIADGIEMQQDDEEYRPLVVHEQGEHHLGRFRVIRDD